MIAEYEAPAVPAVDPAMLPAAVDAPAFEPHERPHGHGPIARWPDEQLVDACLRGDQRAWAALIGRYKNLIYSFPRNYGADRDDAADVFQLVCADLFVELPKLRRRGSVRSWIGTVAAHHACRWKRRFVARVRRESGDAEEHLDTSAVPPTAMLERADREQAVRDAIAQLPRRCQDVVRLLFFEEPPVPYHMVADRLGMTPGSVRWMRARSLRKLETILERSGVAE